MSLLNDNPSLWLDGRLILDCSTLLPGPYLGKLLLNRGARVIKVENPERPDRAREMKSIYADLNEKKEFVLLNLENSADRTRFHALVKKADGLIEGFRPETKLKLGLDEKSLHKINPKLCIASLIGYPEDTPCRDRAGHDLNFAAVTGCLSLFDQMPALPLADLFSAYAGALSLCAAMDAVARTRKGTRVVISMCEVLKEVQSNLIREYQDTGVLPHYGETLFSGRFPCYRVYTSKEGRRIAVGAIEGKFWQKVCDILALPDVAREGYATGEWGHEVIARVQRAFASKSWAEWAPFFEDADCCVEPVLEYSEVYPRGIQS